MKNPKINSVLLTLIVLVTVFTAVGCKNTAHGAGEDIEKMGEKIQEKTN